MAEPDRPFTQEELELVQQNLARLHESSVKQVYRDAWKECEMRGDRLPSPKAIQHLVQAWKWLWKQR